jgi:exosortase
MMLTLTSIPKSGAWLPGRILWAAGPATRAYAALVLIAAALFHETLGDLVRIWVSSSSFRHGLFVGPLCLWLALRKTEEMPAPVAAPAALFAVAGSVLVLLLGRVSGAGLLEHAGFVGVIISGAIVAYGWAIARSSAIILSLMVLLIPFGEVALPALKAIATEGAYSLLSLAGIGASVDAHVLTTASGRYAIADGCAGLNFLLASLIVSAVVAEMGLVGLAARLSFLVMAATAAIGANILRVFAVIAIATLSNGDIPIASDHLALSMMIYGALILLLIEAGRKIAGQQNLRLVAPVSARRAVGHSRVRYDLRAPYAAIGLIVLAAACAAALSDTKAWEADAPPMAQLRG